MFKKGFLLTFIIGYSICGILALFTLLLIYSVFGYPSGLVAFAHFTIMSIGFYCYCNSDYEYIEYTSKLK